VIRGAKVSEPLLDEVRRRVLSDPRHAPSVEALAAELGMSRSAFGHSFRAKTGVSPARFMTEVRCRRPNACSRPRISHSPT
jgi:AraC-like DNA-binding protein